MSVEDESEALHRKVRAFARGAGDSATFESLAIAIAQYQARYSPGYARLVDARKSALGTLASVPAVPTDAFRVTRVSTFPSGDDVATFATSGTTASQSGLHHYRTLETYAELSLRAGSWALRRSDDQRCTVVALAPAPGNPGRSSLAYMMRVFMEHWDGRALDGGPFDGEALDRWLASAEGVDVEGLTRAAAVARDRGEPLLVLATSFALVHLVDALGGRCMELSPDSVVMQTGGFKGKSRIVNALELRRDVAHAFGLTEDRIVGEYGMTELTSQFYEGTRPGASWWGPHGQYIEPPWARIEAVDPETLEPLPLGELGLARIVDLGNVDSAVVIQTQDQVRRAEAGIELFGRQAGAPPRGCSLASELLLGGRG